MKKRVGILGGSFNPIHIGHIFMCQYTYEALSLDKVYLLPNEKPPHKKSDYMLSGKQRLALCERVKNNNDYIDVLDHEIGLNETHYTYETMQALKTKEFKDTTIYFIIGADSLLQIKTWKNYEALFNLVNIVCIMRPSSNYQQVIKEKNAIEKEYDTVIEIVDMPLIELSSTDIRKRILKEKSIKYMVDPDVETYIMENKLFR